MSKLSAYVALPLAAAGGFLLDVASPEIAWWPAAFIGAAMVFAALWQQSAGRGALFGAVSGLAFWGPHIFWLTLYLGPVPWLALTLVMVSWFSLFGLAVAFSTQHLAHLLSRKSLLIPAQAVAAASLWVLREQLQSIWPYGGFAWGRLAHTQAESPLAQVASWTGFATLSGLVALISALFVALAFVYTRVVDRSRVAAAMLLPPIAVIGLAYVPVAPLASTGTMKVAAVQGNSKSGIFDDRENGDVFRDHLAASWQLVDELQASGEKIDVLVWPENSAEFQIHLHDERLAQVKELSKQLDAPVIVGSILQHSDGSFTNSSLEITDKGVSARRYDKRRPVPFAEYMPNRDFFHALAPTLVDLVQLDYAFGNLPAALKLDINGSSVVAGIAICFDIIFDDHAVAMQQAGSQIIFAQTNNADFGRTDESAQQLQIAKLRAIESGRSLVNISTVGTSAMVLPDGSVADRLPTHTAGVMKAELPLYSTETPALKYGALLTAFWLVAAIVALSVSAISFFHRLQQHRDVGAK